MKMITLVEARKRTNPEKEYSGDCRSILNQSSTELSLFKTYMYDGGRVHTNAHTYTHAIPCAYTFLKEESSVEL